MPSFYRKLLKDFNRLSRALGGLPNIPSENDKEILRKLEKLKVDNPFADSYNVKGRLPVICGVSPERIVAEVRRHQKDVFITYWCFWSYDRFLGDHEDWEPMTLVYEKNELTRIDARVHDALVHYTPEITGGKPKSYFHRIGHTPVIKVDDGDRDILLDRLNDGLDYTRTKWLEHCYQRAESDGWRSCDPPKLCVKAPRLDETRWERWGKHSIYLKI